MRTLYLGDNEYSFPDKWDELNPDQAKSLVSVILDFADGTITAETARAIWFCLIAGIDTNVVRHEIDGDLAAENIYVASREFTFFFELEYSKKIDHLDKDIRKLLRKKPPHELPPSPAVRWASKLKYKCVLDAVFAAQLLPTIKVGKETFHAYQIHYKNDILNTTMVAQQYIDANIVFNSFTNSKDKALLNDLVAILYFPGYYEPEKVPMIAGKFDKLDQVTKYGIMINFQAFQSFLARKTHFGILWNRTSSDPAPEVSIGLADTLYSLAKSGYGSIDELSHINLIRFLELSLKNICDMVQYLKDNDTNIAEIADKTGLSIINVKKLM